jgi:Undecaprenyl-phosphate galactose phosphotransferase WbaP
MSNTASTISPEIATHSELIAVADDDIDVSLGDVSESKQGDFQYTLQSLRTGLPLLISDVLAVCASAMIAYLIVWLSPANQIHHLFEFVVQYALATIVVHLAMGIYPGIGLHPACELRGVVLGALVTGTLFASAAIMIGNYWSPYLPLSILTALLVIGALFPLRMLTRTLCRRTAWWGHPAVILGSVASMPELQRALRVHHFPGIKLRGQFGSAYDVFESNLTCNWLGDLSDAGRFCRENHVYWAILPKQFLGEDSLCSFSKKHNLRFHQILVVEDNASVPGLWCNTVAIGGVVGVHFRERLLMPSHRFTKRLFDLVIASALLVLLAPLLIAIGLTVKLTSKGPVIFGHRRIGRQGKHFVSLKFRTMVLNADQALADYLKANPELRREWEQDHKLKKDPRITRIGGLLRKSSLDELPQLWNVIRGEMSLVGPRPIVGDEIEKYKEAFDTYRKVCPGITGLWQISGRNNTTYEERVAFDEFYVKNWSPWFDLYILISTIRTVLLREGAY